jgi:hypothetical protein
MVVAAVVPDLRGGHAGVQRTRLAPRLQHAQSVEAMVRRPAAAVGQHGMVCSCQDSAYWRVTSSFDGHSMIVFGT